MKTYKRILSAIGISLICLFGSAATMMTAYAASPGTVGSWSTNTNSLPQALQNSASVTNNGYIYVLGGQTDIGTPVNTVYYATLNTNGSTGTWTTSTNHLPQTVSYATAVVNNGYVYVFGGYNGSANVSTVYYAPLNANGSVGSWTTSTNHLPQGLSNATSVVSNGYVYVINGTTGGYLNTVYYAPLNANGSVGSWTTNSNNVPQALVLPSSFVYNGYVYVVGGYDGTNSVGTIYYAKLNANGSVGTWTTNSTTLTKGVYAAGTTFYNGYLFEMGGFGNSSILSDVYSAPVSTNGSVGSFTASTSLPGALTYAGSTSYNGYTYLLGGATGATTATVYYASLAGFSSPALVNHSTPTSVVTGSSVTVDVLSGISGNPDPATLKIISGPSHGTAVDPPSTITYTPNKGYVGTDSLTYQVCSLDDESLCSQATLSFQVSATGAAVTDPSTGFGTPSRSSSLSALAILSIPIALLTAVYCYRRYSKL